MFNFKNFKKMENLEILNLVELNAQETTTTEGGYKTDGRRWSTNVYDLRPGADPIWQQRLETWWHNLWV